MLEFLEAYYPFITLAAALIAVYMGRELSPRPRQDKKA